MKRKLSFILLLLVPLFCNAQKVSVINGKWEREGEGAKQIKLYQVEDGALKSIATCNLDEDNKFYFAFVPKNEGVYIIGISDKEPMNNYTFYFKPGDCLNVEVDADSYKLVGKNSKENLEMERWHNFFFPLEDMGIYYYKFKYTYKDYFPELERKLEALKTYKQKYTKNVKFNRLFKNFQEYDIMLSALYLAVSPRTAHPSSLSDYPDYYNSFDLANLTATPEILEYPYGVSIATMMAPRMAIKLDDYRNKSLEELNDYALSMIGNDIIKGEFITSLANRLDSYDSYLNFKSKYEKYLITDSQRERVNSRMIELVKKEDTKKTVDFKFPDLTGKEVALSDFIGKVVYVDVWATWCAPCKAEMPALGKLEKEYHDKDIVFLSVSIDTKHKVWKDYVESEGLGGVQLIAGDKSREITQPYNIVGIPRFMIFGKDGKLIDDNASRPSSDKIRGELDKALAK